MVAFSEYILTKTSNADDDNGALYTLSSPRTISLPGVSYGLSDAVDIGFPFTLADTVYRTVEASPHGWARVSGDDSFTETAAASLYSTHDNVILAPWMQSQRTYEGIKTQLLGTSGSYIRVIEWVNYGSSSQTDAAHDKVTYQLAIIEDQNRIEFRYGTTVSVVGSPDRSGYAASCGAKVDTTSGTTDKKRDFFADVLSASATNLSIIGGEFQDWPGLSTNTGGMPAGKTQYFFKFTTPVGAGVSAALVNDGPVSYPNYKAIMVCDERI